MDANNVIAASSGSCLVASIAIVAHGAPFVVGAGLFTLGLLLALYVLRQC